MHVSLCEQFHLACANYHQVMNMAQLHQCQAEENWSVGIVNVWQILPMRSYSVVGSIILRFSYVHGSDEFKCFYCIVQRRGGWGLGII